MRQLRGPDDRVVASVDATGLLTLGTEPGPPIGLVQAKECFADTAGAQRIAHVDANGRVIGAEHETLGAVDVNGRVVDQNGTLRGYVEDPADAAALLAIVARYERLLPDAPSEASAPLMDEVLDQMDKLTTEPPIQRPYKPLTDEDLFGKPPR